MPVVLQADEPIEIAPGRGDLRYGSVSSWAYPSWYGLHSYPMGAVGGVVDGDPLSFGQIVSCQPWVAAAVYRLLTWSVRVPLKAYRRTGSDSRERLAPSDHPVAAALVTPWERADGSDLVQFLLMQLLVQGNAVSRVDSGRVSGRLEFHPQYWQTVKPIQADPFSLQGFEFRQHDPASPDPVSIDQTLYVSWASPLGPFGISPLHQLGVTIAVEDAARKYGKKVFDNMARPPSAIELDESYLDRERETRDQIMAQMRESVTELYGPKGSQTGAPAILPPGIKWQQLGHTAVEAQLVDQRKVNREEIAAVYQIPPPMLGILDKATYSNIETQREMAYTDSLAPPLILIEKAINAQVVRGLLSDSDVYVEFDFGHILRGDRLKEIQAIREGIGSGVYTINEARGILNLPSSDEEDADALWLPVNNLGKVGGTTPAPPPPPPPAVPSPEEGSE
jgi:HK97 family phage portal protein